MTFTEKRKNQIKWYILEKIDNGQLQIASRTSEAFQISRNTVYRYIRELERDGIIKKLSQKYALVETHEHTLLSRENVDLYPEDALYARHIVKHLLHLPENVQKSKSLKEVFDKFSDSNGGFTRTHIPLKNFHETFPVSRSQAKRLCHRLELFREVELDFDEIEEIGQGFAHELFVVFQNAHPDVKLIPLNTSTDVKKMIYHVTRRVA